MHENALFVCLYVFLFLTCSTIIHGRDCIMRSLWEKKDYTSTTQGDFAMRFADTIYGSNGKSIVAFGGLYSPTQRSSDLLVAEAPYYDWISPQVCPCACV